MLPKSLSAQDFTDRLGTFKTLTFTTSPDPRKTNVTPRVSLRGGDSGSLGYTPAKMAPEGAGGPAGHAPEGSSPITRGPCASSSWGGPMSAPGSVLSRLENNSRPAGGSRSTGHRPMQGRRDGLGRPRGPPGHHGPIAQPSPPRGTAAVETTVEPGLHPTRGTRRVGVDAQGTPGGLPVGPQGSPSRATQLGRKIQGYSVTSNYPP